jgi:hypothetical protein
MVARPPSPSQACRPRSRLGNRAGRSAERAPPLRWKVVMNYEIDSRMLLTDPVEDRALVLDQTVA